jgi:hypothetical protein
MVVCLFKISALELLVFWNSHNFESGASPKEVRDQPSDPPIPAQNLSKGTNLLLIVPRIYAKIDDANQRTTNRSSIPRCLTLWFLQY